jgi:predicted nucleotidyltransferase
VNRPLPDRESLLARARAVLEASPGLRFAFVFGSVARGRSGPLSDVDIAVAHDPPLADARPLLTELIAALATERVDLVEIERVGPLLCHRILRDGIPIVVRDPRALLAFRFRTQLAYLDTAPLRQLWWDAFRGRWQRRTSRAS